MQILWFELARDVRGIIAGGQMATSSVALKAFGHSDIGRVRLRNEDAFVVADLMQSESTQDMPKPIALAVDSRGVLLAISDGMGGAQAGEVASELTLRALRQEMPRGEGGTAEAALIASVVRANELVWRTAVDTGQQGMGATLTAVLIHGHRAYVAEVGDSRAYVLRSGRLVQLTRDQSHVQDLIDLGTVTREESRTLPFRNAITQAIGTDPSVIVALNRFTLLRGDRILLCSDGLSGKVQDEEIRSILMATANLETACLKLIELANHRGGEDNTTVILADMEGDGLPAPVGDERVSIETVQTFPVQPRLTSAMPNSDLRANS